MKYDMEKIDNFDYSDSTDATQEKAREIIRENGIKQIDSTNFVVSGINQYKCHIDEENNTLVCDCKGYENHEYCKHSIALEYWLDETDEYQTLSARITDADLKEQKLVTVEPTKEQQNRMDMLVQEQDEKQIILKKAIPVLEINYDMYLPISFGKYIELDGELDTLSKAIREGLPFLIEGEKGIGKTLAVNASCCKEDIPMVAYSCSSGTTMGDILGKEHLIGDDSVFELGLLPTAIQVANHFGKGILYLDELNALEPEIQKMLNQVIDARRYITVNGHTYRLNKGTIFNIVGTMNPSTYGGTSPLNEDLRSRFIGEIWKYPSAIQLNNIIDWKGIPQKVQKGLLQLAMDTLGMKQKGEIQYVLSTRDIDLFVKAYHCFKTKTITGDKLLLKAIRTSILIKFGDSDDREVVRARAEETFGVTVTRE